MSRPLKVLHLLDVLHYSGAETCLKVAGPLWAAHDITCDVVATGPELGEYAPNLAAAGYRTGHLPLDPAATFFRRLRPFLVSEGYDVVHSHIERANFYVDLVVRSTGARSVQHLHQVFEFDGALRAERRIQRAAMRAAGVTFVACSPDVQDNERDRFRNPSTLLLNWADLDHFTVPTTAQRERAREALALTDAQTVMTSVANCHDFKNHTAMVTAMADLPDHVIWLHVGEGPLTLAEKAQAAALGVDDRIRFLGRLSDPLQTLHAADLYIQPSFHEGMSIAALEALATDLPAMMTDVPGQRMLKPYGAPISWASAPDPASIVAAVRRFLDGGRPLGDADAIRRAIDPERAVAELAAMYRGAA